jgi:hypothetical protein
MLINANNYYHSMDPSDPSKQGHKSSAQNQAAPVFHLQKVPPGTAPKESTFYPDASGEFPPLSNYADDNEVDPDATRTDPFDAFEGDTTKTTSASVDAGCGHPVIGQSSHQLRHDKQIGNKHERLGLEGTGASVDKLTEKQAKVLPRD